MKKKKDFSQLTNYYTIAYYMRKMLTLAENVFLFDGLPKYIDVAYLNKELVRRGSIAFFKDEVMGLLALPYTNIGVLDVYGRPTKIMVMGQNGYTKELQPDEYVIMYDNEGRYPLYMDIVGLAQRMAIATRVTDVNIWQQKTPRIWKTNNDNVVSLKGLLNDIDSFEDTVMGYENLINDDTESILAPAPYITDKVDQHKEIIWNEFLALIGIANLSIQKGERLIKDEIRASFGNTIAFRFQRFEPRAKACEEIKEKLGVDINVSYYDQLPTTLEEESEKDESISIPLHDDITDNTTR